MVVFMVAFTASAQDGTARLQVIHNAADPAADAVDIYLGDTLLLDDFAFRAATPFIDAPAGTEITVGVAPKTSSSSDDVIASFNLTLTAGETYVAVANGVLNPDNFAENPDGEETGFTLFIKEMAKESGDVSSNVDFAILHGSTDAPTVDIMARDVATLADDAVYGAFTDYLSVPADEYILDIADATGETIVATYQADLSTLGGGAAVVFASGFFTPANNQDGPAFGIFAALPDGNVIELPALTTARLQVIHNAADPAAAAVDIYLNGALLLDDFAFRAATPFIDAPANTDLAIGVAPGSSTSADDIIAELPARLMAGKSYVAVANGVLDPDNFAANPDARDIGFTLFVNDMAREAAMAGDKVDFAVLHGATDAPTVDVIARGVGTLVDDAAYGDFTDYLSVPPASYTLDVADASGQTVVATFEADLSGLAGGAAVVFASGFLTPVENQDGNAFGLFAALPDGNVIELPALTTARLQVIHNAADPAAAAVDIYLNGALLLDDFAFRAATPFIDAPAGVDLTVGVAPGTSTSASDVIADFTVNLAAGGTYVAVANGVLDPNNFAANPDAKDIGFTLFAKDMIREEAQSDKFEIIALHGATDAPGVDLLVDGSLVVENLEYGDFTDYLAIEPAQYLIDVTPTGQNETIVATYDLDASELDGVSAIVFASGFLSPGDNQDGPAFGLFAALANGTVVELPVFELGDEKPNSLVFVKGSDTYEKGYIKWGWDNAVDGDLEGYDGTTLARGDENVMDPAWAIFQFADRRLYQFNYFVFITDNGTEDDAAVYDNQTNKLEVWVSTTGTDPEDFTLVERFRRNFTGKTWEWHKFDDYYTAKYVMVKLIQPNYFPQGWRQIVELMVQTEKKRGAIPAIESVASLEEEVPQEMGLAANYPNPFNPETVIRYNLNKDVQVRLNVYDVLGRNVATLVDDYQTAGSYSIRWNALNLPSGIYFYRLQAGPFSQIRRMTLMK
jgi:hypothetical protein